MTKETIQLIVACAITSIITTFSTWTLGYNKGFIRGIKSSVVVMTDSIVSNNIPRGAQFLDACYKYDKENK